MLDNTKPTKTGRIGYICVDDAVAAATARYRYARPPPKPDWL